MSKKNIIISIFIIVSLLSFSSDIKSIDAAGDITPIDIGIRMNTGTPTSPNIVKILVEPEGSLTSPLRVSKNGKIYGIILADSTDANLSK